MKSAIQIMTDSAVERARVALESGAQETGFFVCEGMHGNTLFAFQPPKNSVDKGFLLYRITCNLLAYSATETVTALARLFEMDAEPFPSLEPKVLDALVGQEALMILGESGTERFCKALYPADGPR